MKSILTIHNSVIFSIEYYFPELTRTTKTSLHCITNRIDKVKVMTHDAFHLHPTYNMHNLFLKSKILDFPFLQI